jgi:hypothetical protein
MFRQHRTRVALGVCSIVFGASALGATAATGTSSAAAGVHGNRVFGRGSAKITNPYLPISNFHRTVLRGLDTGQRIRVVRTLQSRTKAFPYRGHLVRAAVAKDVVTNLRAHRRIEKTIDYFAQDKAGTVFYFGEDVNEYPRHKPISHEGQWRLGRDTNTPGVLMPAHPKLGQAYKAEAVPHITHETDHVVAVGKTERVAGHTYHHVIRVRENAGPPPEVEFKTYSRGTGVITEANGGVHLIRSR